MSSSPAALDLRHLYGGQAFAGIVPQNKSYNWLLRERGQISAIPDGIAEEMNGISWRGDDPRCPRLSELRLLRVPHWNFVGEELVGELIVAKSVAEDIATVFERIWHERFPIDQMVRIDKFAADDERSMAANNCSAFCFRDIAATGALSKHALGLAVDINPVQNPYLIGDEIWPDQGAGYLDRSDVRPGMIVRPSVVIDAFAAIGWEWGGDWTTKSDYHHFAVP